MPEPDFLSHVLGPNGGLFALGAFTGGMAVYTFLCRTVIADLRKRQDDLEKALKDVQGRLVTIAFSQLETDQ